MKRIGEIEKINGQNHTKVTLDFTETKTINQALLHYINNHEDKSELIVQNCIKLREDILKLIEELSILKIK